MTAGQNIRANVWRISQSDDDAVGGSVITGTLQYVNIPFRMQQKPEEQLLLQQGLETTKIFTGIVVPGTLDIQERDEIQISKPLDHQFYGTRFRIISVRFSDFTPRDPRGYIMLTLTRSVRAHGEQ